MPSISTVSLHVGPDLEGKTARLPSPTGRTTRRVLVEQVERIGPGMDGSGGYRVSGTWLRANSNDRRGAYSRGLLGSQMVAVESGS